MTTGVGVGAASKFLAAIVESSGDAIIGKDLTGAITVWNASAARLFGYRKEEILGQSILTLIPAELLGEESEILAQIRNGQSVLNRQTFRLHKDGTEIAVCISVSPVYDDAGQLIGAVKTIRNLTAIEYAVQSSWRALDAVAVAMVVVDQRGSIAIANAQSEALFGYQRGELLGKSIEDLVPQSMRQEHRQLRNEYLANPEPRLMGGGRDVFALRSDGAEIPVEIGLTTIQTADGVFVVASIIDITRRKENLERLAAQKEALERSNEDLEQFAYVASHDLQEPLRAVAGCVQLLQKRYQGQIDARADEFIGHAVDGCKRMQVLIEDLLTYSRVGRSQDEMKPVRCDLALADAKRNLAAAIEESAAAISSEELPEVLGDQGQLAMLFQNLIGNAIKFRRPDVPCKIHIGVAKKGSVYRFTVSDNGIGISPEHFERIFLVFQRLHTRREHPGTGIGLAVCKRVVERHGGEIHVDSKSGEGTTFSFTLPGAWRKET